MAQPTTLDILLTRLTAIEARLTVLENHAASGTAVATNYRELEATLKKLGSAIRQAGRGRPAGNS